MDYYIARTVTAGFDDTLTRTVAALKKEGFGVLTEIDVAERFDRRDRVRCRLCARNLGDYHVSQGWHTRGNE